MQLLRTNPGERAWYRLAETSSSNAVVAIFDQLWKQVRGSMHLLGKKKTCRYYVRGLVMEQMSYDAVAESLRRGISQKPNGNTNVRS